MLKVSPVLSPVDSSVWHGGVGCPCLRTLPPAVLAPQCWGLDTHLWLPVMMGLLHPQKSSLWSTQCLHYARGWQTSEGNALSGGKMLQVKLREGEGTESHFLYAPPHHRCLSLYPALDKTVICRRSRRPGTFFRLLSWLSGGAAGPLPTHRHALAVHMLLATLRKSHECLGEQSSFRWQMSKQVAGSCLQTGI